MKQTNLIAGGIACAIAFTAVLGCNRFMPSSNTSTTNTSNSTSGPGNTAPSNTASSSKSKIETPDFTMTAEELDREYTRKGVKDTDLQKYENKVFHVTGRVSMLVKEKKGTTQPWVTLYAPGTLHGVSCYFDDEDVAQMSKLQDDRTAKIQGFQDDFITPEVSPMLKHCQVVE
jgi:hypothetical protein